jgi:deazaflavin-dependent oxidoreductase (nitroreductase family)
MSAQQTVVDLMAKGMNVFHRSLLAVSGGRLGATAKGMHVVELHTTGRKSGQRRSVMLTCPIYEPDRVVIIASKGGDDRHPDWYRNLVAQPAVELTEGGVTRPMRARTASLEEKAALWPAIVEANKGYEGYQKRTERDIPVVICEPRG